MALGRSGGFAAESAGQGIDAIRILLLMVAGQEFIQRNTAGQQQVASQNQRQQQSKLSFHISFSLFILEIRKNIYAFPD